VYIRCKIVVRSRNHCRWGTGIIIKYSECVFVALVMQYSKRVSNIIISDLSGFTTFFTHYLINSRIFEKKVTKCEMRILIFFPTFLEKVSEMLSEMCKGLNAECPSCSSDFSEN